MFFEDWMGVRAIALAPFLFSGSFQGLEKRYVPASDAVFRQSIPSLHLCQSHS